jgi:hypothetical protein
MKILTVIVTRMYALKGSKDSRGGDEFTCLWNQGCDKEFVLIEDSCDSYILLIHGYNGKYEGDEAATAHKIVTEMRQATDEREINLEECDIEIWLHLQYGLQLNKLDAEIRKAVRGYSIGRVMQYSATHMEDYSLIQDLAESVQKVILDARSA